MMEYRSLDTGTTGVNESQRISKIVINSTELSVARPNQDGTPGNGYASFIAYDQYGNDITSSSLANNIKFTCNAGIVYALNGLIKVTPNTGVDLTTLKAVTITATDPSTGFSTSATLTIR